MSLAAKSPGAKIRDFYMGFLNNCLFGNYEMYKNAKVQIEMSTFFQSMALASQRLDKGG